MTEKKQNQNQPKGLILADTTSIEQDGKWFEIPNFAPSKLKIKLTKRSHWRKATKNWTVKKFNKKTHQPYDEIDNEKATEEMTKILKKAITDWDHIYRKGTDNNVEKLPFDNENFEWFLENFINLKVGTKLDDNGKEVDIPIDEWIMNISTGPENFIENDIENL